MTPLLIKNLLLSHFLYNQSDKKSYSNSGPVSPLRYRPLLFVKNPELFHEISVRYFPKTKPDLPRHVRVEVLTRTCCDIIVKTFPIQLLCKHSVNHVFSSSTSIINFTSKKPSYDDTRRSGRDNELLQRAQNDL